MLSPPISMASPFEFERKSAVWPEALIVPSIFASSARRLNWPFEESIVKPALRVNTGAPRSSAVTVMAVVLPEVISTPTTRALVTSMATFP